MKWKLTIERVDNGYILTGRFGEGLVTSVLTITDRESDPLESHEQLLWEVMDYFAFRGSKHDEERIRIVRQKKEK